MASLSALRCASRAWLPVWPGAARSWARQWSRTAPTAGLSVHPDVAADMQGLNASIHQELRTGNSELKALSEYYFDGQGKSFRPLTVLTMAHACCPTAPDHVREKQRTVAMIAEMIHTASLVHDDVIDIATTRRTKQSVNLRFGDAPCILGGDFILARSSVLLAGLDNVKVLEVISQVVEDLVKGELMQLNTTTTTPEERFENYIRKTYLKTASLIARTCHAAAIVGECEPGVQDLAYQFGRDLGIAFQVVDDVLDFEASSEAMGKETAVDLKLGLATAPVLFGSEEFPELEALIQRRFSEEGDVVRAQGLVAQSQGLQRAKDCASGYCEQALLRLDGLEPTAFRDSLRDIANHVLSRTR